MSLDVFVAIVLYLLAFGFELDLDLDVYKLQVACSAQMCVGVLQVLLFLRKGSSFLVQCYVVFLCFDHVISLYSI